MKWKEVKLGEIAEFKNGVNYDQSSFGKGIKVISVADFKDYRVPRYAELNEINPDGIVNEKVLLKEEDILFVRSNGNKALVGRSVFLENLTEEITFSAFCIRCRFVSEGILPKFYSSVFRSGLIRESLSNSSGGTNINNLNQTLLGNLKVPLPPLPTQQKIASILSAYDDGIENNLRRIRLLEEAAQHLYREWFVKFRFPGWEAVRVVDGLPDGWERGKVENLLILQRGFDLPSHERTEGDYPIIASTGVVGYHSKLKVDAPGIVTGRSGTIGKVSFVQNDFWPLNTTLWVKQYKNCGVCFVYFFLKEFGLENFSGGTAVPSLDRNVVHGQPCIIPPKNLLEKFELTAFPFFQQIGTLQKQNQRLKAGRDMLLPRLMGGVLEV